MTVLEDGARHRRIGSGLWSQLWFKNTVAGLIVVAAFTGLAVVSFRGPWRTYQDSVRPAHVVQAGQTETIDGQTWQLGQIRHFGKLPGAWNSAIPKGTQLAVVTIERSGTPQPDMYCQALLTDGVRSWKGDQIEYTVPLPDGTSNSCRKPGPLQFTFLLPEDSHPTAVDIIEAYGTQILIRFEIPGA
ncbi:hypothetical protein [Mycobacteroides franklinii]|uniref:DUF4352 domain-containing protein n=1 Tax=Mycobacteroides franklinii TaxID=948102 RepID=A0A4V3A605_9MYCO|nr:hypothetical protein [Mycobacteroides franklinii]ORA60016.1 hypothetical protein BST24_15545 [Mycobacteroides franklinii]TDH20238.1 hypothetical protein EJ571_15735 [Mycobacteroides franklinii]